MMKTNICQTENIDVILIFTHHKNTNKTVLSKPLLKTSEKYHKLNGKVLKTYALRPKRAHCIIIIYMMLLYVLYMYYDVLL